MVIFFSRRGFIYSWRLVQLSSVALVGASSWFNKQRKSTVGSLPLLRAACRRLDQSGCGPALLVLDAANTLGHLCSVLVLLEIRDSKAAAGEKLTKTKADASQGGSAQLCVCAKSKPWILLLSKWAGLLVLVSPTSHTIVPKPLRMPRSPVQSSAAGPHD